MTLNRELREATRHEFLDACQGKGMRIMIWPNVYPSLKRPSLGLRSPKDLAAKQADGMDFTNAALQHFLSLFFADASKSAAPASRRNVRP